MIIKYKMIKKLMNPYLSLLKISGDFAYFLDSDIFRISLLSILF